MCPSLGLQLTLCTFTDFMASFSPWQGSQYPTLLPAIQPEESSSSSKIEQLLQMGILHFKHLYFVVLKHELHMSASLVSESFARQAAMLFFSSTFFYACFEGKPLEKYIIIIYAFDSAHVKYGV